MSVPLGFLVVLAIALAIVFAYRKVVAGSMDDFVHVSDSSATSKQETTFKQLDKLDRVMKILGAVFLIYAIGFAVWFSLQTFNNSGKLS
jgi:hypothetical protein